MVFPWVAAIRLCSTSLPQRSRGEKFTRRSKESELLRSNPAFTLRELSVSRPNSDGLNVEAKIVMAVYLFDEAEHAAGHAQEPKP